MATVTITLEDRPDGNVEVAITSDRPIPEQQSDFTGAQALGFRIRDFINRMAERALARLESGGNA